MVGDLRAARVGAAIAGAIPLWALMLVVASGARAQTAPRITAGPVIDGSAQVGKVLTAKATWTGDPEPAATWQWLRCAKPTGPCTTIAGAISRTYVPRAADVGSVLRVGLRVANATGSDENRSQPTAAVIAAPAPIPPPTASPVATATPTATAT